METRTVTESGAGPGGAVGGHVPSNGSVRRPAPSGGSSRARGVASLIAPLAVGALGAGALAAVVARDPHVDGSWGTCMILSVTGYYCPGCGGMRAVHDLVHGRFVDALSSNALVVVLVVLAVGGWLAWAKARWAGRPLRISGLRDGLVLLTVFGGFFAFSILRNTPALSALAP